MPRRTGAKVEGVRHSRGGFPPGHNARSFYEAIDLAFRDAAARADGLSDDGAGERDEFDFDAMGDWALHLRAAREMWIERVDAKRPPGGALGGRAGPGASVMILAAIDATIEAEANAPYGLRSEVEGGIVPRWKEIAERVDPDAWGAPERPNDVLRRAAVDLVTGPSVDANVDALAAEAAADLIVEIDPHLSWGDAVVALDHIADRLPRYTADGAAGVTASLLAWRGFADVRARQGHGPPAPAPEPRTRRRTPPKDPQIRAAAEIVRNLTRGIITGLETASAIVDRAQGVADRAEKVVRQTVRVAREVADDVAAVEAAVRDVSDRATREPG